MVLGRAGRKFWGDGYSLGENERRTVEGMHGMTAFHFGSRRRRLFGYYEPALDETGKARSVLLCYPLGNEQVFAYRTMRQLAARLASGGHHVLRFDYFATGDSYGESGEGDLAGWCEDIETAIDEIKEISGAATVNLAGLRLGANLAARVAVNRRKDINKLILWEPLEAGEIASAGIPAASSEPTSKIAEDFGKEAIAGKAQSLPAKTMVLLTEQSRAPLDFGALTVQNVPDMSAWDEERLNSGSIPVEAVQRIVDWLQ